MHYIKSSDHSVVKFLRLKLKDPMQQAISA
jgi:hypothetical protein